MSHLTKSVLIVEDDEASRAAYAEALGLEGYLVKAFEHAPAGLGELLERPALHDAVVLDWIMPSMNGAQFLAAKLAEPSIARIPVIIISGLRFPVVPPGALAVLPKPFPLARLLELLDATCGDAGLQSSSSA